MPACGAASLAQELVELLERFLGPPGRASNCRPMPKPAACRLAQLPPDAEFVHFAEVELAGAIGSASARVMVFQRAGGGSRPGGSARYPRRGDPGARLQPRTGGQAAELEAATAELREANERLRELDRMKDDFISTVTHELRTPLTSIRALSEMLHEDPRTELTDRKRFLGIIVSEAERLTRLINQILDMAKLESGRAEWTTGDVDIGEVVRERWIRSASLFREKGVRLDGDIPDGRWCWPTAIA
jgi:signal transduction histidine kinase